MGQVTFNFHFFTERSRIGEVGMDGKLMRWGFLLLLDLGGLVKEMNPGTKGGARCSQVKQLSPLR